MQLWKNKIRCEIMALQAKLSNLKNWTAEPVNSGSVYFEYLKSLQVSALFDHFWGCFHVCDNKLNLKLKIIFKLVSLMCSRQVQRVFSGVCHQLVGITGKPWTLSNWSWLIELLQSDVFGWVWGFESIESCYWAGNESKQPKVHNKL